MATAFAVPSRLLFILTCLCLPAPLAWAQAQKDASAETQALREENGRLKEENEYLKKRVSELTREVSRMRDQLRKSRAGAGDSADEPAPADAAPQASADKPFESPDAMLALLRARYQEKFASLPRGNRTELTQYQRQVGQWARSVRQEHSGPVEWTVVLVDPAGATERPSRLKFQVAGPDGKPASREVVALLPTRWVRDISSAAPGSRWKVSGVFTADPRFNGERETEQPGDATPLVGPFVEFDYELKITGLQAAP